ALANSTLKDQLAELTRKLGEIEKRQNQEANLLQNVVHMDALRGLVFWHTLGKSITGMDYLTAYAQVNSHKSSDLECPDPDLSSTLRKLGNVASGFDSVVNRIEQLEVYVDCGTSPHMPYPSDNKKLLKKLQDTMSVLQEQINQLNTTLSNVQSQLKKLHETVEVSTTSATTISTTIMIKLVEIALHNHVKMIRLMMVSSYFKTSHQY
ncbi:glutamine rich 2, partial [Schistosoma japonicum]